MKKQIIWSSAVSLMMFFAPLLFVANGACQDEIQTIRLSRQAAIAMAIRNNIDLRVRALDSSLAETDIEGSKAIYNPNLSASVNYAQTNVAGQNYGTENTSSVVGVAQNLPTGGNLALSAWTVPTSAISDPLYDYTDWSSAIGVTFYQPLLKNAGKEATEIGISQDEYAYAGSLESFRDEVIQTVFSVISEYNRLYVLYQLLESRHAALSSAQQLLEEIKTQPNPGDNSAIELSNTEYALSQRQTEDIEATRQVSSKEATLRYLIGVEQRLHIVPLDPPSREEPAETETQAIALALEQSPELKKLRIQLESNELRERVSKRNLWPDLALTATGGYRGYAQDGGFGDTVDQIKDGKGEYWSAGMRIAFPLGNDLAESEYRRNTLRSEQIRDQVAAAKWKVTDAIQDDNRSLISARLQVRATNKSKILAEQRVAQYQKNRRMGTSSVKDLLDAENDLIYARNLELNAIEHFAYLVARLWKDIGVLLERQNIHIDTSRPDEITRGGGPAVLPEVTPLAATDEQAAAIDTAFPLVSPATPTVMEGKTSKLEAPALPRVAGQVKPVVNNAGPAATAEHVSYTLKVGEYLASEVASVKKRIEHGGLVPVVMDGPKQEREVIRLFMGEYEDLASAQQALDLHKILSNGFILKNAARGYEVFAGSFFTQEGAEAEQKRLAARGIELRLKKVTVMLPTFLLTAGSFSSREAAMSGAKKLEQQGLNVEILQSSPEKSVAAEVSIVSRSSVQGS